MCNCGNCEENFAQCIRYELPLPDFSKIDKTCVNLEDTTKDIYEILAEIKEEIPEDLSDKIEQLEEQITQIIENQNICNYDITGCVDTSGLKDLCSTPITTLGQLLNYFKDNL
jgi:hypothetical protein